VKGDRLRISSFSEDLSDGNVSGHEIKVLSGINLAIDIAAAEDICSVGGDFTGFATVDEELEIVSGNVADVGAEISSGTGTSGSSTTLGDTGADFITTDLVAVGDLLINVTQGFHGIITARTELLITVAYFVGSDDKTIYSFAVDDAYSVVESTGTGAAVLRCDEIFTLAGILLAPIYLILNGTTDVESAGGDSVRCFKAEVVLAGATGSNVGVIEVRQATTETNIYGTIIATFNVMASCVYTVPLGKQARIVSFNGSSSVTAGAAGTAIIKLMVQESGGPFLPVAYKQSSTGMVSSSSGNDLDLIPPGANIKLRASNITVDATKNFYLMS